MPRLAQAYSTNRSEIADGVALVTKYSGFECRIQIDKMVQTMFAADRLHSSAVYCLMMLIWYDHPKSLKRDMISLIVEDYLLTDDDSVDDLLRASQRGSTLNITLVGQGTLNKSAATSGLTRLDPELNGSFIQNWLELWTCMVNALCYTTELAPLAELTAAKAACLISTPHHALMARQSERVKDVVARHVTAIRKLSILVDKVGPPHTSPDVITLGTNLLKAFGNRDPLLDQLREVMKTHPPNPIGIDWSTAIDLLTKAELAMDRPNHDQLAEVIDLMQPDTHVEDDTDYENDVGVTPDTGEIPDAPDKGAARPIIMAAAPPEIPDTMCTDKGAARAIIMAVVPTDPDPPTVPCISGTPDSDDY